MHSGPLIFSLAFAGIALASGVTEPARGASSEWHRWRGPDLNGVSKERNWTTAWPQEGPKQIWKAEVGTGCSSLAVAVGRVFTMGNVAGIETVYCIDLTTGKPVWKHTYECPIDDRFYDGGPSATPTVDGDRVYTLSRKGHLFCFDAERGQILWRKNVNDDLRLIMFKEETPEWGYAGSPLVADQMLILNVGSAGAAFDKTSGAVIWQTGKAASGYATPVPFGTGSQKGLVVFGAQSVRGLSLKEGKVLWEYPWRTTYDVNAADPVVSGNKVFITSGYGRGGALLQFTATAVAKIWENKHLRSQMSPPVLLAGHLYGFDGDQDDANASLRCVEFETGKLKWAERSLKPGALMAADNKLIILNQNGELIVARASPDAFTPLNRAQVLGGKSWTTPVLSGGRILCRNLRGDVVCVDVRGRPVAQLTP